MDCGNKAFIQQFSDHRIHHNMEPLIQSKHFLPINGIFVKPEVIDANYESLLIRKMDSIEWTDSQSGRRKQDFGPKVNFKKQKLNFSQFSGLPDFDIQLLVQIKQQMSHCFLQDFIAVEVCHLEYNSLRGSSIDPHFDDFWLWGPRLITVNLLSPTILNLVLPQQQSVSGPTGDPTEPRIRIVLPQRSLLVLWDDSRFKYQHSIQSNDINGRRIAITYRELSPQFLANGPLYEKWGKHIIDRSLNALHF